MLMPQKSEEKKVEYIELIYDLIFVYLIGRNNSMLHAIENGFVSAETFATYLLSALVILHIWYFTTIFINRYGDNGIAEHICIFINMYLLYYMADGTRVLWQAYYFRYNMAWGLILVNLAVQYYLKLRATTKTAPWETAHIKHNIRLIVIEAVIVFASIPIYYVTKLPFAPAAMVFGIVATLLTKDKISLMSVDFPHLTERVMLYVVFTFGEMIIGITGYFEGGVTLTNVYFSFMAFLIVAGLFLTYGYVYDHLIDREMKTNGISYMMVHVFLITALNNITAALEFMREPEVREIPKNIFLVVSIVGYFVFLYLTKNYCRVCARGNKPFFIKLLFVSVAFIVLMLLFYQNAMISIAATVVYIYTMFLLVRHYGAALPEEA